MMNIGIFVGTVYGNALAVAEEAQRILLEHKYQA
ncbi:flavodoxin, partial [Klebsiella aerogenes]|nr:flavodoxin [Klebsiella aerogenes]